MVITIHPEKILREGETLDTISVYFDEANERGSSKDRSCVTAFYMPEGMKSVYCRRMPVAEAVCSGVITLLTDRIPETKGNEHA